MSGEGPEEYLPNLETEKITSEIKHKTQLNLYQATRGMSIFFHTWLIHNEEWSLTP